MRGAERARQQMLQSRNFPFNDATFAEYALNTLAHEVPKEKNIGATRFKGVAFVKDIYKELQDFEAKGCELGPKTFAVLFDHALAIGDKDSMHFLWGEMLRKRAEPPVAIWAKVLHFHGKNKDAEAVRLAYQTYLNTGKGDDALLMPYTKALVRCGEKKEAMGVFRSARTPSRALFTVAISACENFEESRTLVTEMETRGLGTDMQVYEAMLAMLAKIPDVSAAEKVIERISVVTTPTPACWMHLLYAYRKDVDIRGALTVYKRMGKGKIGFNAPVALIELCTELRSRIEWSRKQNHGSLSEDETAQLGLVFQTVELAKRDADKLYAARHQHLMFFKKVMNRYVKRFESGARLEEIKRKEKEKDLLREKVMMEKKRSAAKVFKRL